MFSSGPGTVAIPVALLLLPLAACVSVSTPAAHLKADKDRKPAPDFSLNDSDGRAVQLSDYRGKVVLLNFWATWCAPCRMEVPWLIDFERQHKEQGFAVLGISMDEEGWDAVKPFMTHTGMNYRVLMGNDMVAQLYGGVDSLPTTFMIDREGRIASVHVGLTSKTSYENDLQELFRASNAGDRGAGASAVVAGTN
jgi:peroxiredoxin